MPPTGRRLGNSFGTSFIKAAPPAPVGVDTVSGDAGNDSVAGGADYDIIRGGTGDDVIIAAEDLISDDIWAGQDFDVFSSPAATTSTPRASTDPRTGPPVA